MDSSTAVRQETPAMIGNPALWDLQGIPRLWVPLTHSCGEAMGDFIIAFVASVFDIY